MLVTAFHKRGPRNNAQKCGDPYTMCMKEIARTVSSSPYFASVLGYKLPYERKVPGFYACNESNGTVLQRLVIRHEYTGSIAHNALKEEMTDMERKMYPDYKYISF